MSNEVQCVRVFMKILAALAIVRRPIVFYPSCWKNEAIRQNAIVDIRVVVIFNRGGCYRMEVNEKDSSSLILMFSFCFVDFCC
jgi:hypothetical protein